MLLANGFQKMLAGNLSIEDAHDRVSKAGHKSCKLVSTCELICWNTRGYVNSWIQVNSNYK
jgi:hypothetical protein